jgi:hypothetical protein
MGIREKYWILTKNLSPSPACPVPDYHGEGVAATSRWSLFPACHKEEENCLHRRGYIFI